MTHRPKIAVEIVRTLIWKELVHTKSIIKMDGLNYKVLSCRPLIGYSNRYQLVVQRIFNNN